MVLLDRDSRVVRANEAFARHVDLQPAELPGQAFAELMADGAVLLGLEEAARTGLPLTVSAQAASVVDGRSSDGGQWTWSLTPIRDDAGELARFFLLGIDITDLKQAERRLKTMETVYQSVFDCMSEGVVFQSADGSILAANPAAERLLGRPARQMLGRDSDAAEWEAVREDGTAFLGEQHPSMVALRTGEPSMDVVMGVRRPDGSRVWISINSQPVMEGEEASPHAVVTSFHDVTERRAAEQHQVHMLHELNHRVKNTLAVVQSIAVQTLKTSPDPTAFTEAFNARLLALSHSHELLTRSDWTGAQLRELITEQLRPHDAEGRRFTLSGPRLRLSAKAAIALSLALSELATNAVKYGALSIDGGTVSVVWTLERGAESSRVRLAWRESGGPPVCAPTRRGLGIRLIERSLPHELGGSAKILFNRDGVACDIEFPLEGNAS